jgi:hypothetical protein
MMDDGEMVRLERFGLGLLAGIVVVLNKIVSQGASGLRVVFEDLAKDSGAIFQFFGYAGIAMATVLSAGFIALLFKENSRLKLIAMAVSLPALISAWGSAPAELAAKNFAFITPAFAQENSGASSGESFWRGVQLFFGGAPDVQKYRVVVASAPTPDEAAGLANRLQQSAPSLHVAVADRASGNPYFAVIASDFLPYADANAILAQVKKTQLGANAYLSPERSSSPGLIQ